MTSLITNYFKRIEPPHFMCCICWDEKVKFFKCNTCVEGYVCEDCYLKNHYSKFTTERVMEKKLYRRKKYKRRILTITGAESRCPLCRGEKLGDKLIVKIMNKKLYQKEDVNRAWEVFKKCS